MDGTNMTIRAGVAFGMAAVCVGIVIFILSYTLRSDPPPPPPEEVETATVPAQ